MSAWARAPARGLEPIKVEHKEHYGDPQWEEMYLPQFEPDLAFTKSLRDKAPSSQYGRLVPVVVRPEKVEEVVDGSLRLPKETEALRQKVPPWLCPLTPGQVLQLWRCPREVAHPPTPTGVPLPARAAQHAHRPPVA
jgi:hypothetical protein